LANATEQLRAETGPVRHISNSFCDDVHLCSWSPYRATIFPGLNSVDGKWIFVFSVAEMRKAMDDDRMDECIESCVLSCLKDIAAVTSHHRTSCAPARRKKPWVVLVATFGAGNRSQDFIPKVDRMIRDHVKRHE
jgi:hypothetical protein